MDFELVLKELLENFERKNIRYALMGGFAVGALGAPRSTMDLDFLVHKDDIEALMEIHGRKLDWERVAEYYSLFAMEEDLKPLRERFGHA